MIYKTEPYEHQRNVLEDSYRRRKFGLFMDMGTGKTKVAIDTAVNLFHEELIEAMLIVAPKGVYRNWIKELKAHGHEEYIGQVFLWDSIKIKTRACIDEMHQMFKNTGGPMKVMVINIESLRKLDSAAYYTAERFLKEYKTLTVLDESTCIKNPKTKQTKIMIKLGRLSQYRRILTGTPATESPLDLFSQCEFLGRESLGYRSFTAFKNRYAIQETMRFGGRSFLKVVGYANITELLDRVKEFSYRIRKDECLDLPEKVYVVKEFELTKEQLDWYRALSREILVEIGDDPEGIIMDNALKKAMKLHQICSGHIKNDAGDTVRLNKNPLLESLVDTIHESSGKVIIWARFEEDIRIITERLTTEFPNDKFVTYYGATSTDDRVKAVEEFQREEGGARFFVGTTSSGGYGLTLTAAGYEMFYTNDYSSERRLQAEDRAHRIGQDKNVVIVDFTAPKTIAEAVYQALMNKKSFKEHIIDKGLTFLNV